MRIGHVQLTTTGIALYDVDGSKQTDLSALDALYLYHWIGQHMAELRQMEREREAALEGVQEREGRGHGR